MPTIASHFIDAFPGQFKGAIVECCVLSGDQTRGYDNQVALLDEHKVWNGGCHRCCCICCMAMGLCYFKCGCLDFEGFENYWFLPFAWPCRKYIKDDVEFDEDAECFVKKSKFAFAPTNLQAHDVFDDTLECRPDIAFVIKSKKFHEIIGAKRTVKEISDMEVVNIMQKDPMYGSSKCLDKMLAVEGASILFMAGCGDLIVPPNSIEKIINELEWSKKIKFDQAKWNRADTHDWKKEGNMEMRRVYGAGHLIFVDDPKIHHQFVVEYLDKAMGD